MQVRDWLYVMDHCKAIDMVASDGKVGEVYNVGGHNERPNIFIVKTVIAQLHDRLKDDGISEELITHVADRLGHDRRYGIDPTKIKEDLGWYPETPFEKGIVLTIDCISPTPNGWPMSPAAIIRSTTSRCTKTSNAAAALHRHIKRRRIGFAMRRRLCYTVKRLKNRRKRPAPRPGRGDG